MLELGQVGSPAARLTASSGVGCRCRSVRRPCCSASAGTRNRSARDRSRSPALMPREVCWSRTGAPCMSPATGLATPSAPTSTSQSARTPCFLLAWELGPGIAGPPGAPPCHHETSLAPNRERRALRHERGPGPQSASGEIAASASPRTGRERLRSRKQQCSDAGRNPSNGLGAAATPTQALRFRGPRDRFGHLGPGRHPAAAWLVGRRSGHGDATRPNDHGGGSLDVVS
jgi:hypothetical protein